MRTNPITNVQELRVGQNYYYDGDIIKLDNSFLSMYLQNDTDLYLYPIPLTEEILLKCGYEINFIDFKHFYKLHNLYLDSNFQPIDTFITYEIKYLHQLQNLYFALTNQELNIEL